MAQAYKVDFTTRTVTITAEFEKAMSNPEAAEYKIIRQLCADFPGMRIVKRTHRTPTHYTSKNGEKSACNPYKNLTYEKMEWFMDALPNGAEYRKQYDFLKNQAAATINHFITPKYDSPTAQNRCELLCAQEINYGVTFF